MSKKKEVILLCILFLISLSTVYADEVGCCSNPGAGLLTCSTDRLALRDKECCPKPESSFPSYYKSTQNPDLIHNLLEKLPKEYIMDTSVKIDIDPITTT